MLEFKVKARILTRWACQTVWFDPARFFIHPFTSKGEIVRKWKGRKRESFCSTRSSSLLETRHFKAIQQFVSSRANTDARHFIKASFTNNYELSFCFGALILLSLTTSKQHVWFHWFSWEESTDCKQSPLKTSTHMQLIPRTSDFFQAIENFPEFSFTEKVSNHGYPCVLLALWCPCIIGDSGVNIFNGNLKRIVLQGAAPKVKVWSTYFLPNMLRNLDINMASTAHEGVTKVLFRTTCDMCRFSFDLNYRGHLKECYYFQ